MHNNVRKVFGVSILTNRHKDIRRLLAGAERPTMHGRRFWHTNYLLMDFLTRHPLTRGEKLMELGCGWDLAGIFCAKRFAADVTLMDADPSVFDYADLHASINNVAVSNAVKKYEQLSKTCLGEFNTLIGSEVCFWPELIKPLFLMFRRAQKAGVERIVVADPGRTTFEKLAKLCCDSLDAQVTDWQIRRPLSAHGRLLLLENGPRQVV